MSFIEDYHLGSGFFHPVSHAPRENPMHETSVSRRAGCPRLAAAAALVVALALPGRGQSARFDSLPAEKLEVAGVKPLDTEPVGIAPVRPWVTPLGEPFEVGRGWRHLFTFKKEGRKERLCHPASLDLATGRIQLHPPIPGMETWKQLWLGGRLYLGQNLPGHLVRYDPETDAFTDLGPAFEQSTIVFRMAETPDGKLALAGNHPAELSVYDPESGRFRRYGRIGKADNGYCYELGVQGDYVYGATRGKSPWELVAVNRTTGERTLLATRPTDGYINLSGDRAGLRDSDSDPFQPMLLEGPKLLPDSSGRPAAAPPPPSPRPKVAHDASTVYEPPGLFTIHFQSSPNDPAWRRATLEVPLAGDILLEAEPLGDGRIAVAAGAYVPVAVFDPQTGAGRQFPLGDLSIRSALARDGRIYFTGYPSAAVHVLDPSRPLTNPTDSPSGPGVAADSPEANPRRLAAFPMTDRSGGHIGVGLFPAPSSAGERPGGGRIYLCTRRHRHHRGFSIAWFDPPAADAEEVRSGTLDTGTAFDHLQVGGLAQSLDGTKLLVSTSVEPNGQLTGEPPAAAKLFVIDLAAGAISAAHVPVADSTCLAGVAEVEPGVAVGLAFDEARGSTLVYRIDLADGRVTAARRHAGVIQTLPGTNGAPLKGAGFVRGPDGMIWTSMNVAAERSAVLRIDPASLAIVPVGIDVTNGCPMLFHRGNLYLAGAERLRRAVLPGLGIPDGGP